MSRGVKAIIIIFAVVAVMAIGIVVLSKTSSSKALDVTDSETSVLQADSVSISNNKDEAVGPTFETPTATKKALEEPSPTKKATQTPEPTATLEPKATAVPIPITPESTSDSAQFITSTNMNGYIYCSYKSDKKVKIMMNNGSQQEIYDLVADGQFHRFTLHLGDGDYRIRLVENTSGNSYRVVDATEFTCELINQDFPYLVPNSFVVYNNDMEVIQFGLELTEDAITQEEKAHAIYDWIVRNISYDFSVVGKLEVGYVPDPQRTYDTRMGICSDFATLFASMCRSQGIPCKVVLGYYVKSEYYHAWNEVLVNGEYILVDTSGDSQTKKYNFSRTEGYTKNKEH